jgi:hypothetical protein
VRPFKIPVLLPKFEAMAWAQIQGYISPGLDLESIFWTLTTQASRTASACATIQDTLRILLQVRPWLRPRSGYISQGLDLEGVYFGLLPYSKQDNERCRDHSRYAAHPIATKFEITPRPRSKDIYFSGLDLEKYILDSYPQSSRTARPLGH